MYIHTRPNVFSPKGKFFTVIILLFLDVLIEKYLA